MRTPTRSAGGAASITDEGWQSRRCHCWPGNVRELKGVLEGATNLAAGGDIEPGHLKLPVVKGRRSKPTGKRVALGELEPLEQVERRHIVAVYEAVGRNKSQAARVLGIGLQTVHRKLKSYGVK